MLEVADVLRRYGGDYLDRFGDAVPQRHRCAIRDLVDCRTRVLGGHIYACDRCGQKHFSYHSCRNRHCPKCHGHNVEAWIDARRTELLPVWSQPWIVYAKPAVQGTDRVLAYLGRYVHRVAIANSRILSIDDGRVVFRYQCVGQAQWKTVTLPAHEFIRRFLQHVLPAGVHKVRYYGLWAPSNRQRLQAIQGELVQTEPTPSGETLESVQETPKRPPLEGQPCPHCHQGVLVSIGTIPRAQRAPP